MVKRVWFWVLRVSEIRRFQAVPVWGLGVFRLKV